MLFKRQHSSKCMLRFEEQSIGGKKKNKDTGLCAVIAAERISFGCLRSVQASFVNRPAMGLFPGKGHVQTLRQTLLSVSHSHRAR